MNLLVLCGIVRSFARVRRGEPYDEQDVDAAMSQLGRLGRVRRPVVRLIDGSWKVYPVSLPFGLGFDTATEVGVLGISATAGMCRVDTTDGILMLGAYGWAHVHPVRKLYYNMTITAVSVLIALVVGGIESLGIVGGQMDLHGWFWDRIGSIGDHFGVMGVAIVGVFVVAWATSALSYRLLEYHRLELVGDAARRP